MKYPLNRMTDIETMRALADAAEEVARWPWIDVLDYAGCEYLSGPITQTRGAVALHMAGMSSSPARRIVAQAIIDIYRKAVYA